MKRLIGVVSGKGGAGKTTFVSNVGLALTIMKKSVTVVDADMETSNLGLQLGMYQFPSALQDVLSGDIDIEDAIYIHPSGLRVLPSYLSMNYIQTYNQNRFKNTVQKLDDIVLIDSPPGIGRNVSQILKACEEVIVVTNPEIPAVTDAMKVIKLARKLGKRNISIVINRCTDSYELLPEEIESLCESKILGKIPEDRNVKKSVFRRTPIVGLDEYSPASLAFMKIAAELVGEEYKPPRFLRIRRLFRIA